MELVQEPSAIGNLTQHGRDVGHAPVVRATTDVDDALRGADFVFSAIRVGGLTGRTLDERVALDLGVLNRKAHAFVAAQFETRTTEKSYIAEVWGRIEDEEGTVDLPLAIDELHAAIVASEANFAKVKDEAAKARQRIGEQQVGLESELARVCSCP